VIHLVMPVGMLRCNCSILGDETTKNAIVVDPGANIESIVAQLAKHELTVQAIVVTHAHIDHVAGARELRERTGAPVYMNERDRELLEALDVQASWLGIPVPEATEVDIAAKEATSLQLNQTAVHILETPGHTEGSLCLWIPAERKLIAGDTLFRESIGRTDLPGGDTEKILRSIHSRLLVLPDETAVTPGHGLPTTIGHERAHNPFLRGLL
jgi:hydroxyacylglutathione hydrolase